VTGAGIAERYFSPNEIERARGYHRPLYAFAVARTGLGLAYVAALAFTPAGPALAEAVDAVGATGFVFPLAVLVLGALLRLPLGYMRYRHERRWGFSTQSVGGWLIDVAKAAGLSSILTAGLLYGLFEVAERFPTAWPLVAGPAAVAVIVVLSFLAPVVFEPLFNRFRPLDDATLAAELRSLSDRAGVPVRQVLVSDASRRTTKHNAYVSGLGATRRVVVFDTLLARGDDRDVRLVVAHELGHRRLGHVARGTALAGLGAATAVALLWMLLRSPGVLDAIGAAGASDPRAAPFILLVVAVLGLVSDPLGNAISRRWEGDADRFAVELTADAEGFAQMERELSVENLSDLAPGRLAYLFLFTHPAPPERIAAALSLARPTTT
jgi:STE24 endopeptidase